MSSTENKHPLDDAQIHMPPEHGEDLADEVIRWMQENHDASFYPTAQYLAIGAGFAIAEVAFAARLGIDSSRITIVDRNSPTLEAFSSHPEKSPIIMNSAILLPSNFYKLLLFSYGNIGNNTFLQSYSGSA